MCTPFKTLYTPLNDAVRCTLLTISSSWSGRLIWCACSRAPRGEAAPAAQGAWLNFIVLELDDDPNRRRSARPDAHVSDRVRWPSGGFSEAT